MIESTVSQIRRKSMNETKLKPTKSNSLKRILILGSTGRTGQNILKEALALGYKVNCLVRSSKKNK